jgi:hypothetical protein
MKLYLALSKENISLHHLKTRMSSQNFAISHWENRTTHCHVIHSLIYLYNHSFNNFFCYAPGVLLCSECPIVTGGDVLLVKDNWNISSFLICCVCVCVCVCVCTWSGFLSYILNWNLNPGAYWLSHHKAIT